MAVKVKWFEKAERKRWNASLEGRLTRAGRVVRNNATGLIDETKHGYQRESKLVGVYTASDVGEAPASPTGKLRRNVAFEVQVVKGRLIVRVGVKKAMAGLARGLFLGLRQRGERPTLRPALKLAENRIRQIIRG